MSNELLEKVIRTTEIGAAAGGILKPEQSNRFIDYMWDATVLGKEARTVRLKAPTAEIDKINVGERLLRVATEAVDDGVNAGVAFSKISITTTKLRLDWELSTESLEDNLEGAALEDHIARLMATQVGNDLEDLAINGDTTLTGNALLKAFNGWRKLALTNGHVIDHNGAALNRAAANAALKAMPRRYRQRRNAMRFYSGSNLIQDYLYSLSTGAIDDLAVGVIRNGPVAPEGPAGFRAGFMFGVPVVEVPYMDETRVGTYGGATGEHGDLELTFPENRIWAVKRDVTVYREFDAKKDTIEYTVYVRCGVAIENADAYVIVRNIKVQS